MWAAVDNLLAHDDCRIFFIVLKSNTTVPLSILIYPIVIDYSNQAYANNGQEKYAKYQPDIYVSTRDISRQKTNVTMPRNSKFLDC